jgi:uncharacterized membrane protein
MRPRRPSTLPQLRLASATYRFRESLFLLPAGVMLGGILLAELTAALDSAVGHDTSIPLTLGMSSNAATWLLSTVAGAMITTAGVVFSLTVVSLQLASSQFSPRVMRSFIRDRLSQVVIGLLMATFVYSVLTLRHLSGEADEPAPRIALTVAIVLTVVTVLLIVAHLDHLARGLQVGQVVRSITGEGEKIIDDLERSTSHQAPGTDPPSRSDAEWFDVPAPRDGWVAMAASDRMLRAVAPNTTIRLETRAGAYIHEGEPLVAISPPPDDPEAARRRLEATVVVGDARTMQEDIDFAIRQLVDIGLRALGSGINDPTTAVEVTLRIGGLLRKLLVSDLPPEVVAGSDGRVLVRRWGLSHEEYIAHAFDQLRHDALPQVQVVAALLRVLRMLIEHVQHEGHPEHVPALQRQLDRLLDAVREDQTLHADDRERLLATAEDATDPADHARHDLRSDAIAQRKEGDSNPRDP